MKDNVDIVVAAIGVLFILAGIGALAGLPWVLIAAGIALIAGNELI